MFEYVFVNMHIYERVRILTTSLLMHDFVSVSLRSIFNLLTRSSCELLRIHFAFLSVCLFCT